MSTTPPSDPKEAAKKDLTGAIIWTALAAAFAVFMFVYSGRVEPEKRNFYLLGGAVGAIIAAINGYNAWTLFQKSKEPPAA
jgi:hypothetical protein